ncbi:MAG: RNB domain-containing ribonuclease, partial [Weeksellaceae bacterium]
MSRNKKRKHKNSSNEQGYKQTAHKVLRYLLKYPNDQINYNQIASGLQFRNPSEKEHLIKVLTKLVANKQIIKVGKGKFQLNLEDNTAIGKIDFATSGAAYVSVDGIEEDIYIPKGQSKNALQNDMVRILMHEESGRRREGSILEVIQRNKLQFVGILQIEKDGKYGFVNVDQTSLHVDIFIGKKYLEGIPNGYKVVAEIIDWPDDADSPFGKIIDVLGEPGEHNVEMHAILAEYGLPADFPEEVEAAANALDTSIKPEEIAKRRDMREVTTFTIDPADAKDFDDALSIRKLENGNWEIGVHIADVAHYVQPG